MLVADVLRHVWTHPANRDHRVRAIGRSVAFQLRSRAGRTTHARLGHRSTMIIPADHAPAESVVVYAAFPDWAEMQAWQRYLRPGDLFIDVGAAYGTYALLALELGAEAIAIDPVEDHIARMEASVAHNGHTATIITGIASDAPGEGAEITLSVSGSVRARMDVPRVRLDDLIGDRSVRGIKVDVEGAERLVLEGLAKTLADGRVDLIQLEWNNGSELTLGESRQPVLDLLARHGYRLTRPDEHGELHPVADASYGPDVFAVSPTFA